MKKYIFTESQVKKVVKHYINEVTDNYDDYIFGDYGSTIDKMKRKGEKVDNINLGFYSSYDNSSYYDTLNVDKQSVKDRDISYLGNWKKNPNAGTKYSDMFADKIDMSPYSEPSKPNPINSPKSFKLKKDTDNKFNKPILKADPKVTIEKTLKSTIEQLKSSGQENNWQSVSSLVKKLHDKHLTFFKPIKEYPHYEQITMFIKKTLQNPNHNVTRSELKTLYKNLNSQIRISTEKLMMFYDGTYDSVKEVLNDINFYNQMSEKIINIIKNN